MDIEKLAGLPGFKESNLKLSSMQQPEDKIDLSVTSVMGAISLSFSLLLEREYLKLQIQDMSCILTYKMYFVSSSQEDERPMSPFYVRYVLSCFHLFFCVGLTHYWN